MKAYSAETGHVRTIVNRKGNLIGVAWNAGNQQLYFCSPYSIYRVKMDGSNVKTVLNARNCKSP